MIRTTRDARYRSQRIALLATCLAGIGASAVSALPPNQAPDPGKDLVMIEGSVEGTVFTAGAGPSPMRICFTNTNAFSNETKGLLPGDRFVFRLPGNCGAFSEQTPGNPGADITVFSTATIPVLPSDFLVSVTNWEVNLTYIGIEKVFRYEDKVCLLLRFASSSVGSCVVEYRFLPRDSSYQGNGANGVNRVFGPQIPGGFSVDTIPAVAGPPGPPGPPGPEGPPGPPGDQPAWELEGNAGTTPGTNFLGTTDDVAFQIHVNSQRAFRLEPNVTSPNILGAFSGNSASPTSVGATVGGGQLGLANLVFDNFGTVAGGAGNQAGTDDAQPASATHAMVGGGRQNMAAGSQATVGGGLLNRALANFGTVAGGQENTAGGLHSAVGGGLSNEAIGNFASVLGGNNNSASATKATVAGGEQNIATGDSSTISGGQSNSVSAEKGTVGGGYNNRSGRFATVSGGQNNTANSENATVSGGNFNTASSDYATVGGGLGNIASAAEATIGGGRGNRATETRATIAGGLENVAGSNGAIGGGIGNRANEVGTVGGGGSNSAIGRYSVVGGGISNSAGAFATVSGGFTNVAGGNHSTIAGGISNVAPADISFVGGGEANRASGRTATVGGGESNTADGRWSFIGGGAFNTAVGDHATVGGGQGNTARPWATVPGGLQNAAEGYYSLAAGRRAKSIFDGGFVWADSTDEDFTSTGGNQFLIRARGGVGVGTNSPSAQLHVTKGVDAVQDDAASHVAVVENSSIAAVNGPDVLALKVQQANPGPATNYITFLAGTNPIGAIEGDGAGGVIYKSASADFAEWLPRASPDEAIEEGDIVGLFAGRVTRATRDADQMMVVSSRPILLGNAPPEETEHLYERIAFLGQVSVKVLGATRAGDYIVASGRGDGIGIAVRPEEIVSENLGRVVGRAWESSNDPGVKFVRTVVGLEAGSQATARLIDLIQEQRHIMDLQGKSLKALVQRVEAIERKELVSTLRPRTP